MNRDLIKNIESIIETSKSVKRNNSHNRFNKQLLLPAKNDDFSNRNHRKNEDNLSNNTDTTKTITFSEEGQSITPKNCREWNKASTPKEGILKSIFVTIKSK